MQHWGGHRLGLTCAHLLARLCADKYVVAEKFANAFKPSWILASRLPNGVFHGHTTFADYKIGDVEYIATYNLGALKYIDMVSITDRAKIIERKMVIHGYLCIWRRSMVVVGKTFAYQKVPVEHFERKVEEMIAAYYMSPESRPGQIPVGEKWIAKILPQTCH